MPIFRNPLRFTIGGPLYGERVFLSCAEFIEKANRASILTIRGRPRVVFERTLLTELRNASGIPQGRHCIRALRVYSRILAIEIAFLRG